MSNVDLTNGADTSARCDGSTVTVGADIARRGFTFPAAAVARNAAGDTVGNPGRVESPDDCEVLPVDRAAHCRDQQSDAAGDGSDDGTCTAGGTSGPATGMSVLCEIDFDDWSQS